ncbi:MAG: glycosyltransferase, partial [Candidatus Dadabacteria bacterium]
MKIAFVIPRFSDNIAGGVERLVRETAFRLPAYGVSVDILTTCALDNRSWENVLPEGFQEQNGVGVYRFLVNKRNLDKWIPIQIAISEGIVPSVEEQLDWFENSVVSDSMLYFLEKKKKEYNCIFFAPYLFGTTFWGVPLCEERAFLIPCLHDEPYAYLQTVQFCFKKARGAFFNSMPEMELAQRLYGGVRGAVVGMGFECVELEGDIKPYFNESFRYVLYLGRKETGKGVDKLLDFFVQGKESNLVPKDLKLVLAGGGDFKDLHRDAYLERADIVDIGFVSEEEKKSLIFHSSFVCQPSTNESFSIVIMEAWALKKPVLVSALCPVTYYHTTKSNGGLFYQDFYEFCKALTFLVENKETASILG